MAQAQRSGTKPLRRSTLRAKEEDAPIATGTLTTGSRQRMVSEPAAVAAKQCSEALEQKAQSQIWHLQVRSSGGINIVILFPIDLG